MVVKGRGVAEIFLGPFFMFVDPFCFSPVSTRTGYQMSGSGQEVIDLIVFVSPELES